MAWTWQYESADGKPVPGPNAEFPTQEEAEAWLGTFGQDRLTDGASTAVLLDDGTVVYKMSLES
ncbi:hypothetical protein GCM10027088_10240 [Nocardia goodfellowii]|uniref:Uncharacterized protein n=1 Tax=Nocardia goodfellowii TaxID=882446 RepID=A0ABS4QER3_9NOCA|nr:hypothetical protein [Nocardia goodfellowii]